MLGEFCGKRDIEEFTQNVLEKNCYIASDCQPVFCDEFVREVKKEVLYLRKVSR